LDPRWSSRYAGDGYVVDEAESGTEALAVFEPGKFDLIFTDYFMPEKLQSSDCPLGGIDSFICKPFELETLRAAITRYAPV
jgi:CheY-like chemotaxis protein